MSLPETEKLKWAAIQILENYSRCGVSMVARGSDSFSADWTSIPSVSAARKEGSPAPHSVLLTNSAPSDSTSVPAPTANAERLPLPPMPMPLVPLRSAAKQETAPNSRPATSSSRSLGIAEENWIGPPLAHDARIEVFTQLRAQVAACRKCEELACSRTQTVFGTGAMNPRVVFFGEAPGADEDKKGEPFVGAAGQLLNKIINASQMKREEVYILNSLKCRPPGNRTPVDMEIENCRSFFEAQLDVLQPEFIVCLGAVAVRAVLQTTESVGRLRGRFHRYRKARVLVTYHPAYLLRNQDAKKFVWDDMKLLMGAMGLKLPDA